MTVFGVTREVAVHALQRSRNDVEVAVAFIGESLPAAGIDVSDPRVDAQGPGPLSSGEPRNNQDPGPSSNGAGSATDPGSSNMSGSRNTVGNSDLAGPTVSPGPFSGAGLPGAW